MGEVAEVKGGQMMLERDLNWDGNTLQHIELYYRIVKYNNIEDSHHCG